MKIAKVINYPLLKVSTKETPKLKRILFGALIGGLTLGTFFLYGGYACYYFANRKTKIEDPQDHKNVTLAFREVVSNIKPIHHTPPSQYYPELTSLFQQGEITEDLVKKISFYSDALGNFQEADLETREWLRESLLSFHSLFEEINKEKKEQKHNWNPSSDRAFQNEDLKAHFIHPHILAVELKEEKSKKLSPGNVNLWRSLFKGYAAKGHEDILAVSTYRKNSKFGINILFNTLEENMDEKTHLFCQGALCVVNSKYGYLKLKNGQFTKVDAPF